MDQSRPLFIYFRPSLITISIIQFEKSAWDLNLRLQDGRRRQYHRALAAAPPQKRKKYFNHILISNFLNPSKVHF